MKSFPGMTEQELVKGCKRGDQLAQCELFRQFSPRLYPICIRYVGIEDAQDVLQDGFIKIFEKVGSFRGEGSFEGWMKRIIITTALIYLRKEKAQPLSSDIDEVKPDAFVADSTDAVCRISEKEILSMITSLPEELRIVFNLVALDGLSHREVASMLNITEIASRSRLNRARGALQQKIKKLYR